MLVYKSIVNIHQIEKGKWALAWGVDGLRTWKWSNQWIKSYQGGDQLESKIKKAKKGIKEKKKIQRKEGKKEIEKLNVKIGETRLDKAEKTPHYE